MKLKLYNILHYQRRDVVNDNKSMNALNILIEASRDVDQNIKTNNKDKDQLSIKMIDDDEIDNKMMNIINNDDDNDVDDHDNDDE